MFCLKRYTGSVIFEVVQCKSPQSEVQLYLKYRFDFDSDMLYYSPFAEKGNQACLHAGLGQITGTGTDNEQTLTKRCTFHKGEYPLCKQCDNLKKPPGGIELLPSYQTPINLASYALSECPADRKATIASFERNYHTSIKGLLGDDPYRMADRRSETATSGYRGASSHEVTLSALLETY